MQDFLEGCLSSSTMTLLLTLTFGRISLSFLPLSLVSMLLSVGVSVRKQAARSARNYVAHMPVLQPSIQHPHQHESTRHTPTQSMTSTTTSLSKNSAPFADHGEPGLPPECRPRFHHRRCPSCPHPAPSDTPPIRAGSVLCPWSGCMTPPGRRVDKKRRQKRCPCNP